MQISRKRSTYISHYGVIGYTIDKCFKIHGYPLGYKAKGKSSTNAHTANQVIVTNSNQVPKPSIAVPAKGGSRPGETKLWLK